MLKKLLTKPIWMAERAWARWSFPKTEKQLFSLPVLRVPQGCVGVVVLATPNALLQGLWSVYSLIKNLSDDFSATLIVDGNLPSADEQKKITQLMPGLRFLTTREILAPLQKTSPILFADAQSNPMQRKLAVMTALNQTQSFVYSDNDILAFAPMTELIAWAREGCLQPMYAQEMDGTTNFDPIFKELAETRGLQAAQKMNAGFMALPQGTLNVAFAEQLLNNKLPRSWFTETTLVAFQMSKGRGLPLEEYIVSCRRQFFFESDVDYKKIKMRHFVGPVRHLMTLHGIPTFVESLKR